MADITPMRIALGIEYDGTGYNGWQRQHHGPAVQQFVERALGVVADEVVDITCAGRTDSGVHASGQVIHFDTEVQRDSRAWLLGVNSNLPDDINASWVKFVDDQFHARFSANSRSYEYRILNQPVRSALLRNRTWWIHRPLDDTAMNHAVAALLGEHDFSSFRSAGCQASSPNRKVLSAEVSRDNDQVILRIRANAFLQHMVRNIVGTLVAVGRGDKPVEWISEVLHSKDRRAGGVAAPAQGLTLVSVEYPEHYRIPPVASPQQPSVS